LCFNETVDEPIKCIVQYFLLKSFWHKTKSTRKVSLYFYIIDIHREIRLKRSKY
jgi:hypothetical protein